MADGQGRQELLELLAYRSGCECMSDLHTPEGHARLRGIPEKLEGDLWPLKEWSDAYHYITGRTAVFADAGEVQRALEDFLEVG